ncbi:hypothetical protein ACI3L1_06840 [Deinococcus sp. SM5_A1]|uniref:hypothetical protein n=1 Tax=Deinococcus sp. SM5_A1 TaxID=3379094 RepID=UPI00385F9E6F
MSGHTRCLGPGEVVGEDGQHAAKEKARERFGLDGANLPRDEECIALADYLGCHEEARAAAWAAWTAELNPLDWDGAEYWLDVEFVEPCLEERPASGQDRPVK